ncbi:solute carrier organic anion transporter family member 74D-like [Daphnia pulicaria]|uniref:solute carrier organic anion transporter family member 74D-like n=1 Tax=Daphnia pulicaria TaxID=35523 RepID=UPI001EECE17A|nr:solute carrier organic anion transporter family member 74D-like [Daphnia pulicaria]
MGKVKNKNKLEEDEEDTQCGLGPFHGKWLQGYANKKSYLLTYSFLGLFQAMFFSYSIATLTTLEKQFKLKSQTTGILLSGNEVSQILLSLVITYFGGHGHRPRLAALGVVFSGVASIIVIVPHFVYGQFATATNVTRSFDVCSTSTDSVMPTMNPEDSCDAPIGPMIYIFMSQFVSGIGTTLFSILGITYLDDNVKRKQTPMLIGIMSSLRLIGPAFGYGLAAICMRLYVNLSETTTLKPRDPSWIGAWWLGFMIIGIIQISTAWLLACYPRRLPKESTTAKGFMTIAAQKSTQQRNKPKERTFKEFPAALRRLLTNKILILNNCAGVFFVFALSGYITFLPKYMETQFQQSSSMSGLVNGLTGIMFMCTGLLLAGYLISRFKFHAWKLQVWDVLIGIIWIIILVVFAFLGCDSKPIHGFENAENGINAMLSIPTTSCNEECNCQSNRFAPACSEDGQVNFFSACHAGCTSMNSTGDRTIFSDCSCIKEWINTTQISNSTLDSGAWYNGKAIGGYCPSNCFQMFLIYIFVMGIIKFLSSFGRVSNILITFRCVAQEDKSFAIGLGYLLTSLFAFIPAPIVYGAVIDQACILWRTDSCGVRGNCWIYDQEKMRLYFHLLTAGVIVIGVIFDCFTCFAVRDLDLYAEDPVETGDNGMVASANNKELQPMLTSRPLPPTNSINVEGFIRTLEA